MILVFGTVCVDRVCRLARMPEAGGYVEAISEVRMLGGEAANTAYALRSWGAEVVLAGNGIANDTEGDFVRSELARRGIQAITDHLLPAVRTPVCDVFVDDAGRRTMIGFGFSDMARQWTRPGCPIELVSGLRSSPTCSRPPGRRYCSPSGQG